MKRAQNLSTLRRWRILSPEIYVALHVAVKTTTTTTTATAATTTRATVATINSKHWELFINLLHDSVIDMRIKSYDAAISRLLIGISR